MENKVFLKRYRLSLGRNGLPVELHRTPNGITYRAQEIDSGQEVAIELIPLGSSDEAATAQMRSRAAAARQINHINIPAFLDFGVEDDQLVYVTDHIDGYTAEAWIAARGPLPIGAVLRIALQVVDALGAASFHRIQHSAINPSNIVFMPGQTAEGDWPAIKVWHWLGPNVAVAAGSNARADAAARFASPEQLQGGEVDFASAIFSLGCTMWFLLTGTPPEVPGAKGVRAGVAKLRGVPKIVRHLLGRMLRVNPAERPQDPVVLQAYLQTCLARVERREALSRRLGVPLVSRPRAKEVGPTRNRPVKPLAIAALLLLCATLAVFALPRVFRSFRSIRSNVAAEKTTTPAETVAPAPTPLAVVRAVNQGDPPNEIELVAAAPAEGPDDVGAAAPLTTPEQTAASVAQVEPAATAAEIVAATPAPTVAPVERREFPAVASNSDLETPPVNFQVETSAPSELKESPPPIVAEAAPEPVATATPPPKKQDVASKSSSRKKSRKRTSVAARKSHPRSRKRVREAHAEVRRARKIPSIHVGSSRAELVGTTDDGRWILSVASSGKRIIVPPPPGFDR